MGYIIIATRIVIWNPLKTAAKIPSFVPVNDLSGEKNE
jgi:hypothetical protein